MPEEFGGIELEPGSEVQTFALIAEEIIGLAGPSSAAMEMAISNLCWPGRKVLCLKSGTFSGRLPAALDISVSGPTTLTATAS